MTDSTETPRSAAPDGERPEVDAAATWEALRSEHKGSCPYPCPICIGVGFIGQMSPEVREHLTAAGKELMAAAKKFVESVSESRDSGEVEKIPFD